MNWKRGPFLWGLWSLMMGACGAAATCRFLQHWLSCVQRAGDTVGRCCVLQPLSELDVCSQEKQGTRQRCTSHILAWPLPSLLRFPPPPAASTVSSKSVSTTGSLQRSRSDIDVNAAASAKSKVPSAPGAAPFSSAAALPPGSYASLGNQPRDPSPESAVCDDP